MILRKISYASDKINRDQIIDYAITKKLVSENGTKNIKIPYPRGDSGVLLNCLNILIVIGIVLIARSIQSYYTKRSIFYFLQAGKAC